MRKRILLFFLMIYGCSLVTFSKTSEVPQKSNNFIKTTNRPINNLDSVIFDLGSSTLTATYIDIPIYIKSDDAVISLDYGFKFNLSKLTYTAYSYLGPPDPNFSALAFFNPNDLFLRYTSSSITNFSVSNTQIIYNTSVRFILSVPCQTLSPADFNSIYTLLNGIPCGFRFTNFNLTQYFPNANFSTGPTCSNASVQFSNTSVVAAGTLTGSVWNFSNGSGSTLTNPVSSFTALGSESGTLIVSTSAGCKDTVFNSFNINPPPVSAFSYSFNCVKDSVLFTNGSTVPVGTIVGSLWDFGDQTATSTVPNAAHNYFAAGFYTVTLVSTSNFSCQGTTTLQILLNAKISANFSVTANTNCIGSTINFLDLTTYTVGTINSWNWNFGDGGTSIMQNPSHTYTASGIYSVTLISSSADGCNGVKTLTVNIFGPPVVQFSALSTTACATSSLGFTDQSTTPAGSTYLWRFGDGKTSTAQNPANTYTTGGIYSVQLIVTNPTGCVDSLRKIGYITVNPAPIPVFSLSTKCILLNINFSNLTTISSGTIISYAWNFGDGRSSTLFSPNLLYSVAGNYVVSLSATSNLGCAGTGTQVIELSNKPFVDFEYITAPLNCSGQALSFKNLSNSAPASSYFWLFGDNGLSSLQNPVYTYATPGTFSYTIKLTVTNPGGCSDSAKKNINVNIPFPAVALFADSVIANAIVSFTNLSSNFNRVSWNFGDFLSSDAENPLHTFPEAGTYKICLTAFNSLDCPNQYCKNLYVGLTTIVAVPSGFTPNQDGFNDLLRVRGGPFSELDFRVFNEWGNEVFSTPDQSIGWDGTYKGEPQPMGAYEYVMRGKTIDKKNVRLYGIVNLTR